MLNEQELAAFLERHQLSLEARAIVMRIRGSEPSRRVRPGRGSMTCRYPSRKMGRIIQAESHTNELAAIYTWEYDAAVHEFYDQPEPLKLAYHNGVRSVAYAHTPDFFLVSDAFVGWVECKTDEELAKLHIEKPERYAKRDGKWISPPGEAFASQFGLGYMICPSGCFDWNLLRNLDFLADYMRADCPPPSDDERSIVQRLFESSAWMPLHELIAADAGLTADAVYKVIVAGEVYVDLSARPLMDEFARVYRDQLAATFAESDGNQAKLTVPCTSPFTLEAGEPLSWEGTAYTVAVVAGAQVTLVSASGKPVRLDVESIEQLAHDGKLVGAALTNNVAAHIRENIVRRACVRATAEAHIWIRQFNEYRRGVAVSRCARTMRSYAAKFRQAEVAVGVGALGLIPDFMSRGNRTPRFPEQVFEVIADVEREERDRGTRRTKVDIYGDIRGRCLAKGLPVPSAKTVAVWRKHHVGVHEDALRFDGHRMAYDSKPWVWTEQRGFLPHGAYPFDVAHIDHTPLDLQLVDETLGTVIGRVWLTALIDGYSRKVLAYYLSFDSPSAVSCMMVIRECVRRHGRLPSKIITDGGKEFSGSYFEILLAFFEMQKKTRPPAEGHFGSVMERLFGATNKGLIHVLQGNTLILQCVRKCSRTHDPRRLAIWTLDAIERTLDDWFENVYHISPHGGLQATPNEVFDAGVAEFGAREHVRIPYDAAFILSCLPAPKSRPQRNVYPGKGVKHYGEYYWCEAFRAPRHENTEVAVRYDPLNMAVLYAYVDGEWQQCRAHDAPLYAYRTEREVRLASAALRGLMLKDGKHREIRADQRAAFFRNLYDDERRLREERDANLAHELESEMPVADLSALPPAPRETYHQCEDF
ncbi:DDE-type integrase/transposase/recombinase [Chitinimonas viridis]|uniref:DDE-type integrase/transposase/recombinase n=1 Tax=Chitinimonas viridis TaxID=664880 RepID=A0ABT8B2P1_9NEIS|nr:Mu transposase C-terminal domain-containing protein [Chitinimonas viridis]MDN3576393.1 DDE-type integrase/transposase/recombinase [Chitinimonas viridis]